MASAIAAPFRLMFYLYLILGFAMFGAGMFLLPGWFKLLWVAGCLFFAATLPIILARVLDPLNVRRISRYLAATGATDIKVDSFPNHYMAHFARDGARQHAKFRVKRGKIQLTEREPKHRARDV